MSKLKEKVYDFLVRSNKDVQYEYERYVKENIAEHTKKRFKHWGVLMRLKWHYQIRKDKKRMIYQDTPVRGNIVLPNEKSENIKSIDKKTNDEKESNTEKLYYYENNERRTTVNKLVAAAIDYDVISFDIFDTLVYRKVEQPIDVFNIMSAEMGMNDFADIRKKAENTARDMKERATGSREIVLRDIYEVLKKRFNIDNSWMDREIELEINISMPNKHIQQVYETLLKLDKTVVFTTDMYLPLDVIRQIVEKNGYTRYDRIILSNEYGLRKGDGTLQKVLLEKYPEKRIIHIGDNYNADVEKSVAAGIDAMYNPDSHYVYRENELENIAGSFYRAVIQTNMNGGLWEKDIYYSHGYRVGGILAAGYCNFINQVVKRRKIDKILFCARDCDILHRVYDRFYKTVDTEYINISRYAIFNITSEHYLYDLANRCIMRYMKMYRDSKTIETILNETGYGYLVEELENNNIDRYQFPSAVDEKRLTEFIFNCADVIYEANSSSRNAAVKYFTEVIGAARNVLVVDIGWSGTCISALKYFINENMKSIDCNVTGALLCTNRNAQIKNSIQFGEIEAYINTPFDNMDITRYIFPGPPKCRSVTAMDMLHMPFEYLFTSTSKSLLGYSLADGEVEFIFSENEVPNAEQIRLMQEGIMDFVEDYIEYSKECRVGFNIPPYTAFAPIKETINHEQYSYEVYKDFLYDAMSPVKAAERIPVYGELFGNKYLSVSNQDDNSGKNKRILFVSPEMIYSGAPRSLLRMCKVARDLGYDVTVWSAKNGPFVTEYAKEDFKVTIVTEEDIKKNISKIEKFDMAVCNTVMTSKYAEICCQYIPTVWYIREATNIPDFIRNNKERAYVIKHSPDIYVVSDYAAKALEKYADNPIHVVHNCVEDEVSLAISYECGSGEKVKFVQFGTMEYRKGYDVLLAAYKAMPEEYRMSAELYFAGGFINSGTPFCSYLFREIQGVEGVHYLGLLRGEEAKVQALSQMDVVVVASRDESCSLVALEGAMLSKPLIVTDNVGAKYIVNDENGYIVDTADVEALKSAMMKMIDHRSRLSDMGRASRKQYDLHASMEVYTASMKKLYSLSKQKGKEEFIAARDNNRKVFSDACKQKELKRASDTMDLSNKNSVAIVSLTSHPARIDAVHKCIETLIAQTVRPKRIVLWLSLEQFPNRERELPRALVGLQGVCDFFEIQWVEEDLKPHKKYFYAMQRYENDPVIIVDDDVYYDSHLVEYLLDSYERFPDCVSAMRANLIGFKRDGSVMDYEGWTMGYRVLQDTPSTQLVPTGVGGVLYPPHSIPREAFNVKAIEENCLFCDDLWLKVFAAHAGYKTVMPERFCVERMIEGTQESALWRMNVRYGNNNDVSMQRIMEYYGNNVGDTEALMEWIRKDRFC